MIFKHNTLHFLYDMLCCHLSDHCWSSFRLRYFVNHCNQVSYPRLSKAWYHLHKVYLHMCMFIHNTDVIINFCDLIVLVFVFVTKITMMVIDRPYNKRNYNNDYKFYKRHFVDYRIVVTEHCRICLRWSRIKHILKLMQYNNQMKTQQKLHIIILIIAISYIIVGLSRNTRLIEHQTHSTNTSSVSLDV